ncbi:hypothetical protein ISCGN_027454 [Ixodes scapularis]
MTSATLPLGAQRCPHDWRTRLRSALLGSRPTARRGPAVTAVFRVTTTVVVSPFVIFASRSFVHTMDTTCAESQTYAAVVQTSSNAVDTKTWRRVRCRRHSRLPHARPHPARRWADDHVTSRTT